MSATPEPVGPNSIRTEFNNDGELILYCGNEVFARLRDLLATEACDTNKLPADPNEIASVVLARDEPVSEMPTEQTPIDATWLDMAAPFGCLAILFALFAVFCIGVVTVVRWCLG